nr:hypothetical protein [Tanacetum cinerariifolium]
DWAIQALLRNHFRDLPEADMKEILYKRITQRQEKRRDSPKMPPRSPPHQPPPPLPPPGPSGTSGSPRAYGSSQVLPSHPPPPSTTRKVSHMALPHQALQRQLPQLNINLG